MPKMPLAEKAKAAKRAQATTSASRAAEAPKPAITDKPPVAPKPATPDLKTHQGKIPVKLQQRVAAEVQQERHAPKMASQKTEPEFKVKDPKKIIRQAQPRIAAEVQQERHPSVKPRAPKPDFDIKPQRSELAKPTKSVEQLASEAKQHKFQSRVKVQLQKAELRPVTAPKPAAPSKLAGLKAKATEYFAESKTAKEAVRLAKVAAAPTTRVGQVLTGVATVGRVVSRTSAVAGGVLGAASLYHTGTAAAGAYKAGKELEQKAASAEKKHGLKIDIKKPSLLKAGYGSLLSTEGPQVEVDIKYPKPPKLSSKAKTRLKSLGQM